MLDFVNLKQEMLECPNKELFEWAVLLALANCYYFCVCNNLCFSSFLNNLYGEDCNDFLFFIVYSVLHMEAANYDNYQTIVTYIEQKFVN